MAPVLQPHASILPSPVMHPEQVRRQCQLELTKVESLIKQRESRRAAIQAMMEKLAGLTEFNPLQSVAVEWLVLLGMDIATVDQELQELENARQQFQQAIERLSSNLILPMVSQPPPPPTAAR